MNRIFKISVIIFIIVLQTACFSKTHKAVREVDGAMNTASQIVVFGGVNAEDSASKCVELIEYYDKLFSITNPESDVGKINNSKNFVSVSYDTVKILKECFSFFTDTNGKFDITIGALSELWTESIRNASLPEECEINNLKKLTDYSSLVIKGNEILKTVPNQKINLGAAAKGYISDKLAEYIKSTNSSGAMINLGGNIYTYGKKNDGSVWNIGIKDPRNSSELIGSVTISDKFVVTSGDYERFFDIDGVRYHHIIDAKTGYPSKSGVISVTIISDNGLIADCLSTSCFLLGFDEGAKLLKKYNAEAIFVTDDNNIYYTKGINEYFEKMSDDYKYYPIEG